MAHTSRVAQTRKRRRKIVENREPTETEHELATTERQQEEEDMRGVNQDEDNLPTEDD